MKRRIPIIATVITLGVAFVMPEITWAQDAVATQVSLVWRILRIVMLFLSIGAGIGLIYGILEWRSGSQSNDILAVQRGRELTAIFGILFALFAIVLTVSFVVVRRQQIAINLGQEARPAQPGGIRAQGTADALLLVEALPMGQLSIRNNKVQLFFNQPVARASVEEYVQVLDEAGLPITGRWAVDGGYVSFSPNQTCPSPNTRLSCFDSSTTYEVRISAALQSMDGDAFRCSIAETAGLCQFSFTTGEQIDAQPPSVSLRLPYQDAGVAAESDVLLEAVAEDDLGMASIHFLVDGIRVGIAPVSSSEQILSFRGSSTWVTDGLENGTTHTVSAIAYDLAGLRGEEGGRTVEVLRTHCFNDEQDVDEEGVDCGGTSCRSCQGLACENNTQCASNLCFNGTCENFPVIQEVLHDNGAVGNYVTIRGENFGDVPGQVIFMGDTGQSDDRVAAIPNCEGYWKDYEVIVEVPANAATGILRLVTSDGLYDLTDDDKGIQLSFEVNGTVRPGLCSIAPVSQVIGENVQVFGKGLGETASELLFGNVPAEDISGWSDTVISEVPIPPLQPGAVSVSTVVNREASNPVFLQAQESPTLPRLASVSPDRGPAGQMVSIIGVNLKKDGAIRFVDPRTGQAADADRRLPRDCAPLQTSKQQAFRVPNLEPGIYEIEMETTAGKSNTLSFTINEGERLPGICGIHPDNGPVGIDVTVYGEGLGDQVGGIRFSPRLDDTQVQQWGNTTVRATVPPAAQTGTVQVFNSAGTLSNALNYTVGQCSPDTCETGFECCGNGACQLAGTCKDSVPFCTYSWLLTTGDDLGGVPRVIEDASCRTNTQSPSPFRNTQDACLNAGISARFTHDMAEQTLNRQNITLRRCNSGATLNQNDCQTIVNLSQIDIINASQPGEGFIAFPQSRLDADTWYEVELSNAIQAANGTALLEPYQWVFKTQQGNDDCPVDHVEVTPATATLSQIGQNQQYTGVATALNCNILNANAYQWRWLSQDTAKARVDASTRPTTTAHAVNPTEPGPPVEIYGAIPEFQAEDKGLLSILLRAPRVVRQWPNCSTACVNAALGAQFDQDMQVNSVTSVANVFLYQCADRTCNRAGQTSQDVRSLRYNETDDELYFLPAIGQLRAATTYRVVFSGMRNVSGIPLGGLNYDRDGNGQLDSYSWIFTVREDGALCAIDHVDVRPASATANLIGQDFNYFSFPVSAPDQCSATGQLLNPETYDWSWASTRSNVGVVTRDDAIAPDGYIDPYQVTSSVGEGETRINASAQNVEGSGNFRVTCGYERDTDCPAPATVDTYGVGDDSCCHLRPQVVAVNPVDGADQVCTTLAVEVQFNQRMDRDSVLGNIVLEYNNGAAACPGEAAATAWQKVRRLAESVWSFLVPSTTAQQENWCVSPSSNTVKQNKQGTFVLVYPSAELVHNAEYRVRVIGDSNLQDDVVEGVTNPAGVPLSAAFTSGFTTGEEKCELKVLEVTIDPPGEAGDMDAFFCAGRNDCPDDINSQVGGNQHRYLAIGRDENGYVVPADFKWDAQGQDILSLNTGEGDTVEATPQPITATGTLTVFATAAGGSEGQVSKSLPIRVFLCENPWPSLEDFPYVDKDFGYEIFYCRDAGEPGTHDDLPPLSSPPIPIQPVGDERGRFLQDNLFIVE